MHNKKNKLLIQVIFLSLVGFPRFCFCQGSDSSNVFTSSITRGFGANGAGDVIRDSIIHPANKSQCVYFFKPSNAIGKCPVIFFCHGIGETNPSSYEALIRNIVSRGHCVIYSPYPKFMALIKPTLAYATMWEGFVKGAHRWNADIDTSKIGFVGHSYGGGAIPSFAYRFYHEKQWGNNGLFLYIMAPWYSYSVTQRQLASFPSHAVMVMQVFADDNVNDHRIAADIYNNIGIPASRKTYTILYSDSLLGHRLSADHNVPLGITNAGGYDALDVYGIYRQLDAVMDFSFKGQSDAEAVAIGYDNELREMGTWSDKTPIFAMSFLKKPEIFRPQSYYKDFWGHAMNPRIRYFNLGNVFAYAWFTPRTIWNYYQALLGKS